MNIENQFTEFKSWAENHEILLIEAGFEEKKSVIVEIPSTEDESITTFQNLLEKLQSKIIIYDILHFDNENFKLYESIIDNSDSQDVRDKFEAIRDFEDKLLGYNLYTFSEGIIFKFSKYINEIDNYLEIESLVEEYNEDNNPEYSRYKEIPHEKIVELGKKLAEHENYSKLKSRTQRETFTQDFFRTEFENLNVNDLYGATIVVSYAETYYETKIKPQKEKELKIKITDLLSKGLTKVKIAADLGISKDTLNKYI